MNDRPTGPAGEPDPELAAAARTLHASVDAWTQAVRTVGRDSAAAGEDVLDDPRLVAAEQEFEAAVADFHRAAAPVLGLPEPGDDEGADLEVEELALHLLVGLPEGEPDPPRDAATIVHEAGQRLVGQLTSAGYTVPAWQLGCEVELLLDEDEDDDE